MVGWVVCVCARGGEWVGGYEVLCRRGETMPMFVVATAPAGARLRMEVGGNRGGGGKFAHLEARAERRVSYRPSPLAPQAGTQCHPPQ